MAMMFCAEPTVTYDLDVFVFLPGDAKVLISLAPLYEELRTRGFVESAEHVMIHGVPVQFIVSPDPLADEAIDRAEARDLEGVPFRLMRPEYLAALWLKAGGAKRRERVEVLLQSGTLDPKTLDSLLQRHGVSR